ncbi:F-box only protein 12-like [Papaver somniferum]|uniref:F-box only protein 12-like n=1 Tax=Papaver somniferum TaxID=3469 RepID=UPI000E6FD97C|nr:F-box only protein 12-like [Papaver somniferum]
MEYFNLLPEEIKLEILSRVPAESVLECKLVSTNWRSLVRHTSFSKMHLDHHLTHPVADSEIKRIREDHGARGFGYVDSTNEYKIVRIMFEDEYVTKFVEVYIYTLGSGNGWRNIGKFSSGTREHWGVGVHFSGALYWMDYKVKMIVPFHLAEEKFGKHLSPPPALPNRDFDDFYQLGVLDGCLYFVIKLILSGSWDVWILKKKDDNHDMKEREGYQSLGWSQVVRVYDSDRSELLALTKSYTVLTYTPEHIYVHDPEVSTSEMIVDFNEYIREVFPHKNTLVSLKELWE